MVPRGGLDRVRFIGLRCWLWLLDFLQRGNIDRSEGLPSSGKP